MRRLAGSASCGRPSRGPRPGRAACPSRAVRWRRASAGPLRGTYRRLPSRRHASRAGSPAQRRRAPPYPRHSATETPAHCAWRAPGHPTLRGAGLLVSALLRTAMNMRRKRRIGLLTALAILLFAGSVWAACTSHSKDSDHDGIPNCVEKKLGTNPHSADTDHDGLSDGLELMLGTDPHDADTDGDGESDGMEEAHGRDPMDGGDDDADDEVSVKIKSPVAA